MYCCSLLRLHLELVKDQSEPEPSGMGEREALKTKELKQAFSV